MRSAMPIAVNVLPLGFVTGFVTVRVRTVLPPDTLVEAMTNAHVENALPPQYCWFTNVAACATDDAVRLSAAAQPKVRNARFILCFPPEG